MTDDLWLTGKAARLDGLRAVPSAVLAELVERNGKCLWEFTDDAPQWADDQLTDRELAERLCAGCPVADECLELELRTAGPHTVGVWGSLAEDDRRALHLRWRQRGGNTGDAGEGGGAG